MVKSNSAYHIDFDDWVRLAKSDPDSFENLRKRVLEHRIARAPKDRQQRLRGLQWRINQVRESSSNPMAACISISNMMWSTFSDLGDAYRDLQQAKRPARRGAKVLPFPANPEAK